MSDGWEPFTWRRYRWGAEVFFGIILTLTSLGIGATVLTAQYTGARKLQEINRLAAQVLVLSFSLGIITAVAGWIFSPSIISLFAVEDAVATIATQYLRATFAAAPLALCLYIGNGVFRGNGHTRVPMTIALIVNIFNILASYTLVFGKFGFPQFGGLGAGIATSGIRIQIAALEQIPISAEMVFVGALRGTGDTRTPMLVAFIGTWFFRIPLLWVMVKILHLQLYQIWFLFVADWCLRAIALLIIILRVKWADIEPVNHQSW